MGPIFVSEAYALPRRLRFYAWRTIYPLTMVVLTTTIWLMITGTQRMLCVGDLASFGGMVFQLLAGLQGLVVYFASGILAASAVAQEKDRKTLPLLLMTRLTHVELVGGKLLASLLELLATVTAGLPVFFLLLPLGGLTAGQVLRVYLATLLLALAAGSLGVCVAYWREKTFQSLALVVILLCAWLGLWEGLATVSGDRSGSPSTWSTIISVVHPVRAMLHAASPFHPPSHQTTVFSTTFLWFLFVQVLFILIPCGIAVARVRVWNTNESETARSKKEPRADVDLPRVVSPDETRGPGADPLSSWQAESARQAHIDARRPVRSPQKYRQVWDNPVLWRECATWAYGRKILFIRLAYLGLTALLAIAIHRLTSEEALRQALQSEAILASTAQPLVGLCLISLAILNALAVTSITSERDGRALDLLLATDIRPGEFLFGKLAGVGSVAGLMILMPLLLVGYVGARGGLSISQWAYLSLGLLTLDLFVIMLGMHCGIRYSNSRVAISVSMGTFFFLSLGVATCMLIMISFSGSFPRQLVPFMTIILGGGVGLFAALGAGQPSSAIVLACAVVPFATFYAITSVLLTQEFAAFAATVGSYGFATAAMMVPALYEFDFAMGRTHGGE